MNQNDAAREGAKMLAGNLYWFSLGMGILLLIYGIYVIWPKAYTRRSPAKTLGGVLCAGFGLILLINGLLQAFPFG
ncbi:hypothetical protein QWJ34_06765 [Saccharibacillus sp. CPCC 101409]|uniref:hypothetical protein n=1 Tax=Saccharibacillus sp. CPCC 101409 TaxID=3058041 RepID=UPI0026735B8D|nr:hypothetical protein [Saccharibacillus sp. CPCC 101409]MDO3409459.1 hypothetical protein [Saccharibacillus sp. CPCC 101409]